MNTVEPIRDEKVVIDFADYLKGKNERNFVLFMSGIYLGLRISDILPFRVRDVKNADYIFMTEKKTKKKSRIKINDELKQIYKEYIVGMRDYEFLFQPSRGKNRNRHITRQRVWQILNEAADEFNYTDPIGCHTLRKTFGYMLYEDTRDVAALQDIFNHSSQKYTMRYIGVNQDSKDKMMNKLSFGIKKR